MNTLIKYIFPSVKIFNICSNVDEFEQWMQREHGKKIDSKLLHGYKLFLDSTFSCFFHHLASDDSFGLSESFLLQCAIGRTFYIDKLPITGRDSCEKIVLLKNIHECFKPLRKAKDVNDLKLKITAFRKSVIDKFTPILDSCITAKKKSTYDEALRFLLVEHLYLLYTQINNNGPTAYDAALFKKYWIENEKMISCLDGYKYTLQYMWFCVLGEQEFRKSSLVNLHTSDSWRTYKKYSTARKNADPLVKILSERFEIEEQTSLDSYFYRIQSEIIRPLEEKYKTNITESEKLFRAKVLTSLSKRKVFGRLLSVKDAGQVIEKTTLEEKIEMQLYWYPSEIINTRNTELHNGISAFITALYGTVLLREKNKERGNEKVVVCKFISNVGKKKNRYSYGILIDLATATYNNYGWLFYYDCCTDYSGFSGSEYLAAEKAIKEFVNKGKVELREMKVDDKGLEKYVRHNIRRGSWDDFTTKKLEIDPEELKKRQNNQGKYDELRGIVFELLCYHFASEYYGKQGYSVEWGGMKDDSIDIIIQKDDDVIIVECKLNIDNYAWGDIVKSMERRISRYIGKNIFYEFWTWHEPVKHKESLYKLKAKTRTLNTETRENLPFANTPNLKILKELLNYRLEY